MSKRGITQHWDRLHGWVSGGTLGKPVAICSTALVLTLTIAGCGEAIPSSNGGPATLIADNSGLGTYLEDQSGHSLYLFAADEGGESYCNGACASVWPPYETSGQPMAGSGVKQGELGTITRDDGSTQVTYKGEPLYYYAGDGSQPDQTTGEDIDQFGAAWYLVSPKDGAPVEGGSSSGGAS